MRDDRRLEALLHERDLLRVQISLIDAASLDETELVRLRLSCLSWKRASQSFEP